MPQYKGKVIEVHRQFNMLALAQDDPEVKAWYGQAFRGIGPYFKNKTSGSGLTFDEQRLLLPEIVGMEPTDRDFRKTVTDHYHSFLTKIPHEGIKLQISLQDDNFPLSETNMPVNLKDYVIYRHLLEAPDVAINKYEAERQYNKKFYIVNPEEANIESIKINDLEDKATAVYMKYKDDAIKADQILTMLGVNVRGLKAEDKVLKLKEFVKKDGKLNEFEQKEVFNKFINTAEDRDLEYRYLIQEMIGAQYLSLVGTAVHLTESGEPVGEDMSRAVMYYKNPKNSRALNLLKAAYLTKVKKGEDYLPKEIRTTPITEKELQKAE